MSNSRGLNLHCVSIFRVIGARTTNKRLCKALGDSVPSLRMHGMIGRIWNVGGTFPDTDTGECTKHLERHRLLIPASSAQMRLCDRRRIIC